MKHSAHIILTTIVAVAAGCSGAKETSEPSEAEIAAQYRDSVLLISDVERLLPPAISPEDSVTLAQSIIDEWINGLLIEDLAASQIDDLDRIERLTQRYYRSLIAESYRRKTREQGVQPVDEDAIGDYYKRHASQMKLERPIVKGLFIKLPTTSRRLNDIRTWMSSPSPETYDELENIQTKENAVFRYFADKWIDFDVLAGEIPYRFNDADKFLEQNSNFEVEHNGNSYILHIAEYKPSGSIMPEDYATPIIEDRIKSSNLEHYEAALIKALRRKAIEKNILREGKFNK